MKILILTYYLSNSITNIAYRSYAQLAEITNKNKMDYCNYWNSKGRNYTFFPWIGFFGASHPKLSKISLMLYLFKTTDYDVIFFQDTDTFIMNFTIPVESFIDEEHSFFITEDAMRCVNAGMYVTKTDANALKLFTFLENQIPKYPQLAEQNIIKNCCCNAEWEKIVKIVPQRLFNSYFEDLYGRQSPGDFQNGDYLIHLPGIDMQKKIEILHSERIKENIVYPDDFYKRKYYIN